ncbi:MAG: hypothetical protein AAGE96_13295 [Cyanobacteria bacterium P01_G01_bin.19]
MSSSTNAIANEGAIVTDLGMIYLQIPVKIIYDRVKAKFLI